MSRGVQWSLFGVVVLGAVIALAGCSHYMFAEREPWRHDAEVACLNSGAVKETPERVRISAINGPGVCGADFPLRVSALGDSAPLGYDDEAIRPPDGIPNAALPQRWPLARPPSYNQQSYSQQPAPYDPPSAPPMSLTPPGLPPEATPPPYPAPLADNGDRDDLPPGPPHPYPGAAPAPGQMPQPYPQSYPQSYPPPYTSRPAAPPLGAEQSVPLGPARGGMVTGSAGPVAVRPPATLACPIVSALDQWIARAVQPASLHWFRQPVVGIKQISAYSCRGMNGNPNAHISEHAFGNALDIAEFDLADGHRVSVQYGWHGSPEEQGFLHDVQLAACEEFTTVLAPGANVYHYNHIHVDLMRHARGRRICEPAAVPGEVVAERARARYAAQHYGDPGVTGSIKSRPQHRVMSYSHEDDDRLPLAEPGDD